MKYSAFNKHLGFLIQFSAVFITLLVTPFTTNDPYNLPKLSALIVLSFSCLGFVLTRVRILTVRAYRVYFLVILAFIMQLIIVLVTDDRTLAIKLYGTSFRNTGFLAYLSLTLLLLAALLVSDLKNISNFLRSLIIVGGLLTLYGIAQSLKWEFYNFKSYYSSNVFGTFGNPNFQSAFMGIIAALAMTLATFSAFRFYFRTMLFILTILALYVISFSSQQGYISFIAGFAAAVIMYLFKKQRVALGWAIFGVFGTATIVFGLGLYNKGPLAEIVYQSSVQARTFFWRAAIQMMMEHPFNGVGMDGFGDWYRRSRTEEIAKFNSGIVSTAAHSIPLDVGSNGGVPLFVLYVSILGLAVLSIIRLLVRKSEFDPMFAALVAAWVAYEVQTLISINQLGLGVWGWLLTGFIIGYEINTREPAPFENKVAGKKSESISSNLPGGALLVVLMMSGIGFAIALPLYLSAAKFFNAVQSGDVRIIQSAAYLQPYDRSRFLYVASIFTQNDLEFRAIKILRDASEIYPDSFEIWQQWSTIDSASPADIAHAKAEMKRLDPHNPNL